MREETEIFTKCFCKTVFIGKKIQNKNLWQCISVKKSGEPDTLEGVNRYDVVIIADSPDKSNTKNINKYMQDNSYIVLI